MRHFYLIASIIGAIVPYIFFFQFITVEGINITLFISSLFVNGAAGGFTADLLITSFVFWVYMFTQAKHQHAPSPYIFIVLNLTIGLSCALPAYLYVKEKHKQATS